MKEIVSFLLVIALFYELYHLMNYYLKIKKKYPLVEITNTAILFLVASFVFVKFNFINYIISCISLLYILSLKFNLKFKKINYDYVIITVITLISFYQLNIFLIASSLILIYMIYSKDISYIREVDFDLKPHHYSMLTKKEFYEKINEDISFLNITSLDENLSKELKEKLFLIRKFLKDPEIVYADEKEYNLLKNIKVDVIQNLVNKLNNRDLLYSFNPKNYQIQKEDFERNNDIDKYFNKKYKFRILKLFDSMCVKTGKIEEIEMDHFLIPKSRGGNFILLHKDGYLLINAVPLTKSVNLDKKDDYGFNYFSSDEVSLILKKLEKINILLNKDKKIRKLLSDRFNK